MRQKYRLVVLLLLVASWSMSVHADQKRAFSEHDLLRLLAGGVYTGRIVRLIRDRGISFVPTARDLTSLRIAGADLALLNAVESARHVTAQLPEHVAQPQRVAPLARPSPVEAIPANIRNVRPATSVVSKSLASPVSKAQTARVPGSGLSVAVIPGSTITVRNWQQYSKYMPLGMMELFKGDHFWKMPPGFEILVGPTVSEKLPAGYAGATARYSHNVRVVHLGNGRNDILNYAGGEPFPNPQDPDKGYKLLADLWFAYVPHLQAGTPRNPLSICSETSHGFLNCERLSYVYRQTAYNTDGEVFPEESKGSDYWYTEWLTVEEPEELRYTTLLMLYPKDSQRAEELFTFVPSFRRWFRSSLTSRCSPVTGTDYMQDDFKRVGFNGGLGMFDAQFLEHRQILALTGNYSPLGGEFPRNYYMPLGWPKPSWGNWQLRDVDVIDIRRVRGEGSGYCYGKRIIYEDAETHYALWEDAYDRNMRFWKTALLAQRLIKKPGFGEIPGSFSSTAWDFKGRHLTNASTQGRDGGDVLVDGDVPAEYRNFTQYSTPAGLAEIMK